MLRKPQFNNPKKQVYLQIPDYGKVQATIDTLHGSCRLADGSDDPAKGNQLLEVYGITIQLCTATNNNALMKQVCVVAWRCVWIAFCVWSCLFLSRWCACVLLRYVFPPFFSRPSMVPLSLSPVCVYVGFPRWANHFLSLSSLDSAPRPKPNWAVWTVWTYRVLGCLFWHNQ